MRMLLAPIVRASVPLLAAIAVGAWLSSLTYGFGGVADETCRDFVGESHGNDPSQNVILRLCVDGEQVRGTRVSEGDAGRTVFQLAGHVTGDDQILMTVAGVPHNAPAAGWVTCTDDIFRMTWDESKNALVGTYVSEQCADSATLLLRRQSAEPAPQIGCGH